MIKTRGDNGQASVTFTLDPRVGADQAAVCGEWNDWSDTANVMQRQPDGAFSTTIDLDVGRAYRFRYFLDGSRWENDWAADAYVPNDFGGDDSLVDLTALGEEVPAATAAKAASAKKAPAKKTATKAAATTKATTAKKTTGEKAAKSAAPAKKATKKTAK